VITSEHRALRERLLFDTPVSGFGAAVASVAAELEAEGLSATMERRAQLTELAAELAVDLGSYLVRWHLRAPERDEQLDQAELDAGIDHLRELLRGWGSDDRLAEVDAENASIGASNLRKLSDMADADGIDSRWGHDAASGLTWAIRRGAVLVTTNPVMVNTVCKEDPDTWDPVRDRVRAEHPQAGPEERASLMTLSVVLDECRELLPIFRATDGRFGRVSLQISPRSNSDAVLMASEARDLYARLGDELGDPPNTLFKIPGTSAGLEAVRLLTAEGIGVTVTVSASVDQVLAFADVIEQGSAPTSLLVLMMGRLDDPVRDELMAAGVDDAEAASRWASVAVLRRAYPLLYEQRGYGRSAVLAASMRGPWSIDGSIARGPVPTFITCFPDKARGYDEVPREIRSELGAPLPEGVLERLEQSDTFRRAYGVGVMAPAGFDSFVPVVQTLAQFMRNYDEFVAYNA
jgi:transaldolase